MTELYDDCNFKNKPKKRAYAYVPNWVTIMENMRFEKPSTMMSGVHISKEIRDAMVEELNFKTNQ